MTEQEKREKTAEEMSRDCFISVRDARRVYDAGYRKELDTVKEVLSIVENRISEIYSRMTYLDTIEDKLEGYEKDFLQRGLMQLEYEKSALNSIYDKITERYGIEEDVDNDNGI